MTSDVAHTDQDVLVRAVSDTYWTDVSGAIAVGTGSAGVGIGGDIVVQVKDTRAFIATGADVRAADDVVVQAYNSDRIHQFCTFGRGRLKRRRVRGGSDWRSGEYHKGLY